MIELNPAYGVPYTMNSKNDLKGIMKRIIEENPKVKPIKIYDLFSDECINDPDLNKEALLMTAVNLYNSIKRYELSPDERRKEARRKKEEDYQLKKRVTKAIQNVKKALILNTILPNGKMARDSTGRELINYGGALAKIGAKVKPNQIVGKYVTDQQAQKILKEGK